jgi:hypothetical protein
MNFNVTTSRGNVIRVQAKSREQALLLWERRGRTALDGESVVSISPAGSRKSRKAKAKARRLQEADPWARPERW